MIRIALTAFALFALPFAAFAAWRAVKRRDVPMPVLVLSLVGAGLVGLGFVAFAIHGGDLRADGGTRYVPAHTAEDGTFVPGRFVPE